MNEFTDLRIDAFRADFSLPAPAKACALLVGLCLGRSAQALACAAMDLEELRSCLVQANRNAVAELAAWIKARIEKVPRHDVGQRFQHRLLHAGMFAFQV